MLVTKKIVVPWSSYRNLLGVGHNEKLGVDGKKWEFFDELMRSSEARKLGFISLAECFGESSKAFVRVE